MLRDVRDLTAVLGALVYDDIARPYCVYFFFFPDENIKAQGEAQGQLSTCS